MAQIIYTKPRETRTLGWYAVRRAYFKDWLRRQRKQGNADNLPALMSQTDAPDTGAAKDDSKTADGQAEKKDSDQTAKDNPVADYASEQAKMKKAGKHKSTTSQDARKLKAVVEESHTILAKARAVFPLQLFPDAVNIDRHKLTIIHRQFFGVEQKVSVPLENIKNIEADFGPFFGSITVTSDLFVNNTQDVHFLWRNDAKKIQKLVQGAVVAQGEGIDLNKIETSQLRNLLIDLGSGHTKSM